MMRTFVILNLLLICTLSRTGVAKLSESHGEHQGLSFSALSSEGAIGKILDDLRGSDKQQVESVIQETTAKAAIQNETSEHVNKSTQLNQIPNKIPAPSQNTLSLQVSSQSGTELGHSSDGDPHQHDVGVSPGHPVTGEATSQHGDVESHRAEFIDSDDILFIIIIAVVVVVGFVGILLAGVCYFRLRRNAKAASQVAYPAYKKNGQIKEGSPTAGDRKLAQSAQMFHYQHQKQQMIAMEKANVYMKHDASEDDTDDPNLDGDYTVFECPGLAPTGEMEIKNPFFRGVDTPVTPAPDPTDQPDTQGPEPRHQK